MDWSVAFVLVAVLLAGVINGAPTKDDDAKKFLSITNDRLTRLFNEISDETFISDDRHFSTELGESDIANSITAHLTEVAEEAKRFNTSQLENAELIRAIEGLRSADLFVLDKDFFKSFTTSLAALQQTATDSDICNYLEPNQCNMAYLPDVRKVFSNSVDPKELQFYWQEWREKQLGFATYHFLNVVEFFRKAADLNGITVSKLWFRSFNDGDFLSVMEAAMQQLKPFYQEFHAYIRRELSMKYGRSVLNQEGAIPDHLIEQVLLQAWKKQSVLSHSYPMERLPNLKEGLESQGFDIGKIMGSAEDFYGSLGFEPVSLQVRMNRFKQIRPGAKDCKPDIYDKTSKVYMKYCKGSSFKRFLQSHGYLGRIHFALEKAELPFYFFRSYDLEYPVGEAVILSASTPKHMDSAEILNNFNYTNELAMNRLFRMGVHTVFNIAIHFVNTKLMVDVLEGRVPLERANQHYWKLMDEYAGIVPPVDRKQKYLDFSYKFFEDLAENFQTRKFVSELLGYQFYESFCLRSRQFVPSDPSKPLHACDFYGNKDVGAVIKQMMKSGSKKSWRETINIALGTREMSASSLLEYYKPLYEWLREKNRISGTKVGWSPSKRDVL